MIVSEIKLYELLKSKLGTEEAEAFVAILEKKVDEKFVDAKQMLATKEDVANVKADIIKWMFIFWIGQLAAIIGIVKLFFVK
jgi:predicted nucleic acid-binding protein